MKMSEIWNEAFNIYTDRERTEGSRYNDMQKFLRDQVEAGGISKEEKFVMARDIMEAAELNY